MDNNQMDNNYQQGFDQPIDPQPVDYQQGFTPSDYDSMQPGPGPAMNIVSMIMGIASIVSCGYMGILGIPAIIVGALGLKKGCRGKGMGITGIITGAVGLVLGIGVIMAILVPTFIGYSERASYYS